jgi:CheY-like chemotaxis protein
MSGTLHALVVEDSPTMRQLIVFALSFVPFPITIT